MLKLGFCHDQVSLSQVMDLYCFVYDFLIFSLINDYDDVFGDLEWFQARIYVKRDGKAKTVKAKNLSETGQASGLKG